MARIIGVEVPDKKKVEIGLTYIYGIGKTLSRKIVKQANIPSDKRIKELSDEEIRELSTIIQKGYRVEGDLHREISSNIKRLIDIKSYRGTRHKRNLPVRGQKTHSNARTRKGPRKTVGIIRSKEKKSTLKTKGR